MFIIGSVLGSKSQKELLKNNLWKSTNAVLKKKIKNILKSNVKIITDIDE